MSDIQDTELISDQAEFCVLPDPLEPGTSGLFLKGSSKKVLTILGELQHEALRCGEVIANYPLNQLHPIAYFAGHGLDIEPVSSQLFVGGNGNDIYDLSYGTDTVSNEVREAILDDILASLNEADQRIQLTQESIDAVAAETKIMLSQLKELV